MSEIAPVSPGFSGGEDRDQPPGGIRRWLPYLPDRQTAWRGIRRGLLRAGAVLGTFLLLLLLLTGVAGWYTSRSEFCRSCHIMEPYYQSWKDSTHSDVSCIKCHFAPGFGEEVWGKMLGLVQLAKYVTQTESPRPAAEIPNASCLRMGCHERRVLSGRVEFHGMPFDHEPHLVEVREGMLLRCTSCHSQIVQGQHMAVTASTCFLCHFKDGRFNEGLGACTRCHQIPDKKFDLGGGVPFTHDLAYEKGLDCVNCHGDLIRGDGKVPRERCVVCHNREADLEQIGRYVFLHEKHVTEHKIDCLDCHAEIVHRLDRQKIEHAAANCTACHPDHHREQVKMLLGIGGKSIPAHAGEMPTARVECRSCHRFKEVSPTGTVLWRASAEVCATCHDASAAKRLESYHQQLRATLADFEATFPRIRTALKSAGLDQGRSAAVTAELDALQADLNFLRAANDIHNIHYAAALMRALWERLGSLCRELKIPGPKAALPQPFQSGKPAPAQSAAGDTPHHEGTQDTEGVQR
jgi:predicted CXXCH cytochrome family protein